MTKSFPIVGIGASAGGLEAFTQLLQHLPLDTGMAFVLVQHLDPAHESALTDLLTRITAMPVREVTNNLRVEPNHVYVIPPNAGLVLDRGKLKLLPRKQIGGAFRSIDSFFESLAQARRDQAIGVVLSGTATDGTLGLEAIKAECGITFAQDQSAKYDSMPRSAIAAGCVDFVLSPESIAHELGRIAKHPYVNGARKLSPARSAQGAGAGRQTASADELALSSSQPGDMPRVAQEPAFRKILLLLRNHSGVDFSLYKPSTIERRITRRMVLNKSDTLEGYAGVLRGNARELEALYSDLLINVTSFFRNPEAFDALKRQGFALLLQGRREGPLRMWVLGCSTGQEAYSLAMAYLEFCENNPRAPKLLVFATDLNEAMLAKARRGFYAKGLIQDISPERLRRFFVEEQGGYRVTKSVRDLCVFARQNLLSDPPFSHMDLVSCRNLLIYIQSGLQQKLLPAFHYALNPGGLLFLGASESVGQFTDLFEPVDKKLKIFSRKPGTTPRLHLPVSPTHPSSKKESAPAQPSSPPAPALEPNAQREADRFIGARFAPPGVLVNGELQILQFRGATGAFLEPATGKASFHLMKMARPELRLPLRAALQKAARKNQVVRTENVRLNQNDTRRTVNLEIVPLKNLKERCYLVFFEEAKRAQSEGQNLEVSDQGAPQRTRRKEPESSGVGLLRRRIAELERELGETRDYLQSVQEQHEASNEELQSSNEEVTSANEELQSINEELETSKEELESTNEELTTVNEEMAHRNTELNRVNSELHNLQVSVNTAILVLGRDLHIKRFTPVAEKVFNLLATDLGRPLGGIRHNLDFPGLEEFLAQVIASAVPAEREVRDQAGHWFSLRARPFVTLDNQIDGAVLMLVDIDALKEAEAVSRQAKDALNRHALELEKAVDERTVALRETVRELEAFSYSMVHDMRAPLRAMNSFARMLHEEYGARLDDPGRGLLQRIFTSAERLDQLIEDVLNYTHVLRDEAPLTPVSLDELLRDLLATYPDWQPPQTEVEIVSPLPNVLGHKALLAQCFSQLVGNAIRFVAPGVKPQVRIWAEPRNGMLRIKVQDNGIGIAPQCRDRVFQMFQRLHPASKYEGTGIGLAIVRCATERMGGQVGFDSQPGKGSTFWIELPLGK